MIAKEEEDEDEDEDDEVGSMCTTGETRPKKERHGEMAILYTHQNTVHTLKYTRQTICCREQEQCGCNGRLVCT